MRKRISIPRELIINWADLPESSKAELLDALIAYIVKTPYEVKDKVNSFAVSSLYKELDKVKSNRDEEPVLTKTSQRFVPPTIEEATAYAQKIGFKTFNATKFINYYEARGWKIGNASMKSWEAAIRTWKSNTLDTSLYYDSKVKGNYDNGF